MVLHFYFWGVQGIFSEVVFTGVREMLRTGNWDLVGESSVWSFLQYGLIGIIAEVFRGALLSLRTPLLWRCFVYACVYVMLSWTFAHHQDKMALSVLELATVCFVHGLWFEAILYRMEIMRPSSIVVCNIQESGSYRTQC